MRLLTQKEGNRDEKYFKRKGTEVPEYGIYPTRYAAQKAQAHDEWICSDSKIVKVDGGYQIMDWNEYRIWKGQR